MTSISIARRADFNLSSTCYILLKTRQSRVALSIRQTAPAGRQSFRVTLKPLSAAAPSRSPEPQWPSPPQWPVRSLPFQVPRISRVRRSSCASGSCTRARTRRSRSRPARPRRRALDQALAELEEDPKAKHPSTAWRREFSLLLGLERCCPRMSRSSPTAPCSRPTRWTRSRARSPRCWPRRSAPPDGNGRAAVSASPELLASADILGPEDVVPGERRGRLPGRHVAEPEARRGGRG